MFNKSILCSRCLGSQFCLTGSVKIKASLLSSLVLLSCGVSDCGVLSPRGIGRLVFEHRTGLCSWAAPFCPSMRNGLCIEEE